MSGKSEIALLERLSQTAAAHLVGRSARTLRREGCPRRPDGRYSGQAVVTWAVQRALERAAHGATDTDESRRLLNELRRERLREARRENEVAENRLCDVVEIRGHLAAISRSFQHEARTLERAHGRQVGEDIRAMIDRAETAWRRELPTTGGTHNA